MRTRYDKIIDPLTRSNQIAYSIPTKATVDSRMACGRQTVYVLRTILLTYFDLPRSRIKVRKLRKLTVS